MRLCLVRLGPPTRNWDLPTCNDGTSRNADSGSNLANLAWQWHNLGGTEDPWISWPTGDGCCCCGSCEWLLPHLTLPCNACS